MDACHPECKIIDPMKSGLIRRLDRATVRTPRLAPREEFVEEGLAIRIVGESDAGGMLFITTQRIVFAPTFLDRWLGRETVSLNRSDVAGWSLRDYPGSNLKTRRVACRLDVQLDDGTVESFSCRRRAELAAALDESWR